MVTNTSFNKSQAWHIDDSIYKKFRWFSLSTDFQIVCVKIWAQSDYYFTNYSYLNEANVANFQNNGKNFVCS